MDSLLVQENFLDKYKIDLDDFNKTTLNWKDLEEIHDDYGDKINELDRSAYPIFNTLIKINKVHSVRYRIKDPEHVIEKIIRKRIKNPNRIINIKNYFTELTDLIGVRAIHLFKNDWIDIHKEITGIWKQKEKPIYYFREGDKIEDKSVFKSLGCKVALHPRHYRSVHYIIKTNPTKQEHIAEIQVRTLFEEGWSEIDHKIRYPYNPDNSVQNDFLSILNRLAGSADEMGSLIEKLRDYEEKSKDYQIQLRNLRLEDNSKETKSDILASKGAAPLVTFGDVEKIQRLSKLAETLESLKITSSFLKPISPLTYNLGSDFGYNQIIGDLLKNINSANLNIPKFSMPKLDVTKDVAISKKGKSAAMNKSEENDKKEENGKE